MSNHNNLRPKFHFTPPSNWMNDPVGLIYYNNEYHIFYQHFPYENRWGTMHWGHAVTKEFTEFLHLPVALYPTKSYDKNGCFSGTAIEKDGKLYLYYTSIIYDETSDENTTIPLGEKFTASQSMLISDDGYTFDNLNRKKLVIPPVEDATVGHKTHTRDPKVWKYKDSYYMLLGSKRKIYDDDFTPCLLFFKSQDGEKFSFVNSYQLHGKLGNMWECPDILEIDGKTFIMLSAENIRNKPPVSNMLVSECSFDNDSCTIRFESENFSYLDYGLDFYAGQSFTDKDGKTSILGWLRMTEPLDNENFTGILTMPRTLSVKNGKLFQQPHANIVESFTISANSDNIDFKNPVMIKAELSDNAEINIGGYKISFSSGKLIADRTALYKNEWFLDTSEVDIDSNCCSVDIYVDLYAIEIYINGGEKVISHVINTPKNYLKYKKATVNSFYSSIK